MNLEELRKEVELLIDDPSFDADSIDGYINQAIQYTAELVKLPSLKGIGIVTASAEQAYVSITTMPGANFPIMTKAVDSDGEDLDIYQNLEQLMDEYPGLDKEGAVEAVTLEGNTLWYQPIPTTTGTISLVYYSSPDVLSNSSDSPSDFPKHLHRKLFAQGAAHFIFDMIEDLRGEEIKVNTINQHYHSFDESNKHSGISKLREWISVRKIHHINSIWSR